MLEELLKDINSKADKEKFVELLKGETIYEVINNYDDSDRIDAKFLLEEKAKLVGVYKLCKEKMNLKIKQPKSNTKNKREEQMNSTDFSDQPIKLYCGDWTANNYDGIVKFKGDQEIRVGFQPLLITKRLVNIENSTEKFEIAFYDRGKWNYKFIPRTVISSTNTITKLVDYGIEVSSTNASNMVNYLFDLYIYNKDIIPIVDSVNHLGWVDKEYKEFLPFTKSNIICDCEGEMKNIMQLYREHGSYEVWEKAMRECRKKDIVKVVLASSLASPLIKITGINGFITHICGDRGKGKTILLMAAMGLWGSPGLGELTNSINNTLFALECRAYFLQNLPFSGDELQNVNKKEINNDSLIYMIANGTGKGRGDKDQNVQKQKSWCLNMITTGEDKITKDNSHSGSKVRCVEIENEEDIFDIINLSELAANIKENYGFAGKKFIEYIISLGKEVIVSRFNKIREEFLTQNRALDGKQINAISLLKLSNQFFNECIFEDEEPLSDEYLLSLVKNELEISVSERAKEYLLNEVSSNIGKFIKNINDETEIDIKLNSKIEIYGYIKNNLYYINKNKVDEILEKGSFSFSEIRNKWIKSGFINAYKGRGYCWNTKFSANFVQVKMPVLDSDEVTEKSEKLPF